MKFSILSVETDLCDIFGYNTTSLKLFAVVNLRFAYLFSQTFTEVNSLLIDLNVDLTLRHLGTKAQGD